MNVHGLNFPKGIKTRSLEMLTLLKYGFVKTEII